MVGEAIDESGDPRAREFLIVGKELFEESEIDASFFAELFLQGWHTKCKKYNERKWIYHRLLSIALQKASQSPFPTAKNINVSIGQGTRCSILAKQRAEKKEAKFRHQSSNGLLWADIFMSFIT